MCVQLRKSITCLKLLTVRISFEVVLRCLELNHISEQFSVTQVLLNSSDSNRKCHCRGFDSCELVLARYIPLLQSPWDVFVIRLCQQENMSISSLVGPLVPPTTTREGGST